MKEIWKDYKTYGRSGRICTWIEISNLGNIKGHLFKFKEYDESKAVSYDSNGRKILCSKPLYRIVDELFRGKKPKGIDLHHADFDKTNDRLDNILRLTREEHMRIHGTGENNPMHNYEYSEKTRKRCLVLLRKDVQILKDYTCLIMEWFRFMLKRVQKDLYRVE